VEEITLVLADGTITTCSLDKDGELFRAALVSLGTLGIVVRLTMRASPQVNLAYTTETISLERFLTEYDAIWSSAVYVRGWWWPYNRKVVIWRGDPTHASPSTLQSSLAQWFSDNVIDRKFYQTSLYALRCKPRLLPAFEKVLFRAKFPSKENVRSEPVIDKTHHALQMDCLFSQYVDEWSVPLSSGIEAISRLDRWITHNDTSNTGIPVNAEKVFVHAPIEIRVSSGKGDHAYLSPARNETPVIWIGVIMYRPYFAPTAYRRYFAAYEHLMRSLGGKPHWAKQHSIPAADAESVFGDGMTRWLKVRARVDPRGIFVNAFVKRHLLGVQGKESLGVGVQDGDLGRLYKRHNAVL
jgi:D-arabinono-1,4-lactone oxidase